MQTITKVRNSARPLSSGDYLTATVFFSPEIPLKKISLDSGRGRGRVSSITKGTSPDKRDMQDLNSKTLSQEEEIPSNSRPLQPSCLI